MTESPSPDHKTAAPTVPSTDGSQRAEPDAPKKDRRKPARFGLYLDLLGQRSVPVVLIALGLSIVAADDEIDVSRIPGWGVPQYVGMLAFASLLVVLGCIERIAVLRSPRAPAVEPPPGAPGGVNGRRPDDERYAVPPTGSG